MCPTLPLYGDMVRKIDYRLRTLNLVAIGGQDVASCNLEETFLTPSLSESQHIPVAASSRHEATTETTPS